MTRIAMRTLFAALALLTMAGFASGQTATGTPPFGSFGGGPFDTINLGNLNAHFAVPVIHKAGRGMAFTYDLSYDSSIWYPVTANGNQSWQPVNNWGWRGQTEAATGYVTYTSTNSGPACFFSGNYYGTQYTQSTWTYHDSFGGAHIFGGSTTRYFGSAAYCPPDTSLISTAGDGSGWTLWAIGTTVHNMTSSSGKVINPPVNATAGAGTATDRNGNQITVNNSAQFFDTLSSTTPVLTISGSQTPSSPLTFAYIPPANESNGTTVSLKVNYIAYTVATNFGVSGIFDYPPASISLADNITLADGSKYSFTYEKTPGTCTPLSGTYSANCVTGRIASVSLPTGGKITYSYSGGSNGIFSDGTTAGITRAVSPGGQWTYNRSLVSGTTTEWTTTVKDPNLNPTTIYFRASGNNYYETERQVVNSSGATFETVFTCYNGQSVGTPSGCPTAAVTTPINRRTVFTGLPDMSSSGVQMETDTQYYGGQEADPSEIDTYDYANGSVGSLIRKVIANYATYGNTVRPTQVKFTDANGVPKAETDYHYDETNAVGTSGTPQHAPVSGARGNLTTIAYTTSGSSTIKQTFINYDTGNVQTATDVNGANTTYSYGTTSTLNGCGNSFVTSIAEPLGLSRSMDWDCTGGVMKSALDENGNPTSVTYSDPYFWRPASAQDQAGYVTSFNYKADANNLPTELESSLLFNNNNSIVDHLAKVDGLGRLTVSQVLQAPGGGTYNSAETDYDLNGRVSKIMLPYSAGIGAACSGTCPGMTAKYDALGRITSLTDGGGGSVTYTYTKNVVFQTVSPAPTGENTKRKQVQYDGLGRITSVCEVTGGTGSAACAQNVGRIGYLTKYTYDAIGNLIGVTQNAQASATSQQTRMLVYDELSRLTSETNPESGTTTYIYDSVGANYCAVGAYSSPGDLVATADANVNHVCYYYDALHRLTDVGNNNQSATNYCRRFRYDNTNNAVITGGVPSGVAVGNIKDRLMEATTDNCAVLPATPITDEWFSYSARGEVTDVYESTPNSGGYYHVNASYWAHGALNALNGGTTKLPGLPTIYYGASDGSGLDGEGRITKVNASSGQNPVTGTQYSAASQVTGLTFGSLDNDAFTFDPTTLRMTQYQFNVGATPQSVTGALNWNKNGTLNQLVITDQHVSSNTQTCNYTYDDLARIAAANCGTAWNQTFAYDPFGNISKSATAGTVFQATYVANTNHITQVGSTNASYDLDGNLTYDTIHNYTWDVYGQMATVDGTTAQLTYDALGRMVEQVRSSGTTQIMYSPIGGKLALMNVQTLSKAYVPLVAGAEAVYISTGLSYYRHPDWLGSGRVGSGTGRGWQFDINYAPYGEEYNSSSTSTSFTGQKQDTLTGGSGLYDFLYREYRPAHGRWISPDPAGLSAADPANPQSWNRYAYVLNNPLGSVDFSGLCNDGLDNTVTWDSTTNTLSVAAPCMSLEFDEMYLAQWGIGQSGVVGGASASGGGGGGVGGGGGRNGSAKQPCIDPARLTSWNPLDPIQGAYKLSQLGAALTGETVGVGVGGAAALGIGGFKWGLGFQGSGSAIIATDRNGNSAVVYGDSLSFAAIGTIKGSGGIAAAANFGAQVFVSPKLVSQLVGLSGGGTMGVGPLAIDVSSNGVAVTFGLGWGGRLGGGSGGASGVIPICHK